MSKSNIEKLANYSVVLIALLALVVSFWQVKLFQNHNKLTVTPYLNSNVFIEDSILMVSFSNKGLGPAVLKEMSYEINDTTYSTIFDLLKDTNDADNILKTYNYSPESVVSNGETKILVHLKNPKARGIKVNIKYSSIYNEEKEIMFEF